MESENQRISIRTVPGNSIQVGTKTVIPEARVLVIPWKKGGLVWNHPLRVILRDQERDQPIPIMDVTRILQIMFYTISALLIGAGVILSLRERGDQHE